MDSDSSENLSLGGISIREVSRSHEDVGPLDSGKEKDVTLTERGRMKMIAREGNDGSATQKDRVSNSNSNRNDLMRRNYVDGDDDDGEMPPIDLSPMGQGRQKGR